MDSTPDIDLRRRAGNPDERPVGDVAAKISLDRQARALSHDLRGPLATTISGLRLVSQFGDRLPEDERRQILEAAIDRLGGLVEHMDALLDEATIDSGEQLAATDVGDALQWALAVLDRPEAERLMIVMDEVPRVMARRVAVRQILQNIISNTLRHNDGPVSLIFSATEVGSSVHLHLDDDGAGFPEQVEALRADGVSGNGSTGLGLATIDIAMERMGGRVELGNSPRGGARVTLIFRKA